MTSGVYKNTVFKSTVFKTNVSIVEPTFTSNSFYFDSFNTDTPPSPTNISFDFNDGITKKELDRYEENQKKLNKVIKDKQKDKLNSNQKRLQTIKDIVDPKPKETVKEEPKEVVKEVVKEVKQKPIILPKILFTDAQRNEVKEHISEKRHLLSLIKIVYQLDDYNYNTDDLEYSNDEELEAIKKELNEDYNNIKVSL